MSGRRNYTHLTEEQRRKITELHALGCETCDIASRFGFSVQRINQILRDHKKCKRT